MPPKKWCFFLHFLGECWYSNLIFHKKGYVFTFIARRLLHFKRDLASRDLLSPFSWKIVFFFSFFFFLRKLLNNKISRIQFAIKRVRLIFGARRLLSLKCRQMCTQNSFSQLSRKTLLFSKKLLN